MNTTDQTTIQVWVVEKRKMIQYTETYVSGARPAKQHEKEYYYSAIIELYRSKMNKYGIQYDKSLIVLADDKNSLIVE